jgi:GNAT superfamily N-acetyltransferase
MDTKNKAVNIKTHPRLASFEENISAFCKRWNHDNSYAYQNAAAFEIRFLRHGLSFWPESLDFAIDIRKLYVIEDFRSMGHGSRIINILQSACEETGCFLILYACVLDWHQRTNPFLELFSQSSGFLYPASIHSMNELSWYWN